VCNGETQQKNFQRNLLIANCYKISGFKMMQVTVSHDRHQYDYSVGCGTK